jgi:transposase
MLGNTTRQVTMLSALSAEELIPKDHPIRRIKAIVDPALRELSPVFDAMYAQGGRHSIPPERLLKGCLLIAFYSVRSERQTRYSERGLRRLGSDRERRGRRAAAGRGL